MLPPLWILIQDSVTTTDAIGDITGLDARHFTKLFTDKRRAASMWNSLVFAAGSTVLSLLPGGVLAWLVERTNAPLQDSGLPGHHHLDGHALHPARDRLAVPARQGRPAERPVSAASPARRTICST